MTFSKYEHSNPFLKSLLMACGQWQPEDCRSLAGNNVSALDPTRRQGLLLQKQHIVPQQKTESLNQPRWFSSPLGNNLACLKNIYSAAEVRSTQCHVLTSLGNSRCVSAHRISPHLLRMAWTIPFLDARKASSMSADHMNWHRGLRNGLHGAIISQIWA